MDVLTDLSERRTGSVILRVYGEPNEAFMGRDPHQAVLLFQPQATRGKRNTGLARATTVLPFSLARQGPMLRRSVASFPFVVDGPHWASCIISFSSSASSP